MTFLVKLICLFQLLLITSCTIGPLTAEEQEVKQIYKENDSCRKITEINESNKWDGSFKDVKNRLKKTTLSKGGNAFMIEKVVGQARIATAFVYLCK